MKHSKACLIVDALSSAMFIAPEMAAKGYACFHLFSSQTVKYPKQFLRRKDFVECMEYDGNYEQLLKWAREAGISLVIGGMDAGIYLCDRLSGDLGLVGNDPATTSLRRDKYDMCEAIRKKGLLATPQFKSSDLAQIISWVAQNETYPVVLKTVGGAASTNVKSCGSESELTSAYNQVFGKIDVTGLRIDELVVQGFVDGIEYYFNTVSRDGDHYVTDMWRMTKIYNGADFIPYYRELLPYDGHEQEQIRNYGSQVLDATGVKNGACHTEIKISSKGPCLIEVNPRLAGSMIPQIVGQSTNRSPVRVLADAMASPELFVKYCREPYEMKQHTTTVFMSVDSEGFFLDPSVVEQIRALPSVRDVRVLQPIGTALPRTKCLGTVPAKIELVNSDLEQVEKDRNKILALNRAGIAFLPQFEWERTLKKDRAA